MSKDMGIRTGDSSRAWQALSAPHQIDALMDLFGHFHDACVRKIHVATGHYVVQDLSMSVDWRTSVHLLVQRQFPNPSAVELRFEEVVGLKVSPPPPDCESIVLRVAFFLRDRVFYWAENSDWSPESTVRDEITWVAARRAWWRDASEWMGPDLRYREELRSA
ncbi:MAG: hypothetical protein LAP87_05005 [Acidobacteriia bacterium]|nr:hypothetical protein [Terriglobia bacterium]